jgi:putative hydrolase of the HAD superfamily
MPYKVLLIDLDGVIRHWPESDVAIEEAHGLPIGSIRKTAFHPDCLLPAISGKITDERWRAQIGDKLREEHGALHSHAAVAAWTAHPGHIDNDVLAALDELAASLRLILVTNATSRLPDDLRNLGLADRFDTIINSSEVGVAKPSLDVFRIALRRADVVAEQALFVDDSHANTAAAAEIGIRSHCFRGTDGLRLFLQAGP